MNDSPEHHDYDHDAQLIRHIRAFPLSIANAIKYIVRAGLAKDVKGTADLQGAGWYLRDAAAHWDVLRPILHAMNREGWSSVASQMVVPHDPHAKRKVEIIDSILEAMTLAEAHAKASDTYLRAAVNGLQILILELE